MPAKFNNGCRAAGVVAYQDSSDADQFYYFPQTVYSSLGDNLSDFLATYWGISDSFYDRVDGKYQSISGAVLGGKAKIDITEGQQKAIEKKIKQVYKVALPRLLPLFLSNVKVQPTFAENTLGIGVGGDSKFPETLNLGTEFAFTVAAPNIRFASVVAARNRNSGVIVNPQFGINITGEAEFRGEPWTAEIECDLAQVWSYVRTKVSASGSWGWFKIGSAEYENIVRDLYKDQVIRSNYVEGSIYTEQYGRQMFEEAKKVFEMINANAVNGTGFFKFEPITDPQNTLVEKSISGLFGGFSASVNLSYTRAVFTQKIHYKNTFRYEGNFKAKLVIGMSIAVSCNNSTYSNFIDLNDSQEPCITDAKLKTLNERIKTEEMQKEPLYARLQSRAGQIPVTEYSKILASIDNLNASETLIAWNQANLIGTALRFEEPLVAGPDTAEIDTMLTAAWS
jgi:hypothetical protein